MSNSNDKPSHGEIARTAVDTSGDVKDARSEIKQMLQQHYDNPLIVDYVLTRAARDSRTTIRSKLGKLSEFEGFLNSNSLSLSVVSGGDIGTYTDSLAYQGQLVGTIEGKISVIRSLFDYLEEEHDIDVPKIKVEAKDYEGRVPEAVERQAITREEVRKLIRSADGVRDSLIIAMFYYTGMRRSELEQCNREDVELDQRIIKVRQGKGNKTRVVPYKEELDRLLTTWIEQKRPYYPRNDSEALFLSSKSGATEGRLGHRQMYKIVMNAADDAGIQKVVGTTSDGKNKYRVKPHVLRHSMATHMVDDGVPLRYIQRILGHERLKTTLRYAKETVQSAFDSYHDKFSGI